MQITKDTAKDFIFETLETFVTSFVILMVIYVFLAFPIIVHGASMDPNLETGQRIIVEKISKNLHKKNSKFYFTTNFLFLAPLLSASKEKSYCAKFMFFQQIFLKFF